MYSFCHQDPSTYCKVQVPFESQFPGLDPKPSCVETKSCMILSSLLYKILSAQVLSKHSFLPRLVCEREINMI